MRKTFHVIIFLIIILLTIIYLVGQEEVEAAKVTVEITKGSPLSAARFNESERDKLIGDVALSKVRVKKVAAPKGSDMYLPGISVGLFRDKKMISEWTSVPVKEKGIYEITLGLKQPIEKDDIIRIAVYVNDEKGNVIIGKKKDALWE